MERLRKKIRDLAFTLALEEEIESKFANHWSRKQEHYRLLNKLYRLEKRQ